MGNVSNNSKTPKKTKVFDLTCFLQLIAVNIEYKPVILTLLSILEVWLTTLLASLKLPNLADNAAFNVVEGTFGLIDSAYELGMEQFQKIEGLAALGGSCTALDEFLNVARDNTDSVIRDPYERYKTRYFRLKQLLDLKNLKILGIENMQQFITNLKEAVNDLPDIPPVGFGGTASDVFKGY